MNDPTLTPDDPRLTAYALGELSGDVRAHVEAAVRDDPALRAIVEEIRATAAQVESALAAEAREEWDAPEAVNGHSFRSAAKAEAEPDDYDRAARRPVLLRFPQLYVVLGTAAAACFAVYVHLHSDEYAARQQAAEAAARTAQEKRLAARAAKLTPPEIAAVTAPVTTGLETQMPPALRTTNAQPAGQTDAPPPATDTQLGLLAISKPEQPAAHETPAPPPPLITFGIERAAASGVATVEERSTEAATRAPSPPAVVPKRAEPVSVSTAIQSAPAVANTARVAAATPFSGPSSAPTAPSDEIVRLDAFEVNADRVQSFINSSAFTHFQTVTRGLPEPEPLPRPPPGAQFAKSRQAYAGDNDFVRVTDSPVSNFSVDVDHASYAHVRRTIEQGTRPAPESVRIEEMVNYFPYAYAAPGNGQAFAASLEVASAPWAPEHRLVRIGLKAREVGQAQRAPANLVFLVDVSASMGEPNKLPLVRDALRLLVSELRPDDRVAIVTYASRPAVVLPSTPAARASAITAALAALKPAGTTDGAGGLQLAYQVALGSFAKTGVNRVFLCTDGAFNVGTTSERDLLRLIDEKTKSGLALTVLGFGRPHEHSTPLERLAHRANATYGYIDSRREAEKLMVDEVRRSLATIARDVKVQVEFNPAKVLAYRLLGYENRPLRREDYGEERGAVGEVGAGQAVTALYEIVPALPGDAAAAPSSDYIKYAPAGLASSRLEMPDTRKPPGNELLTVNVRYRNPNTILPFARTQEFAVADTGTPFAEASADFRFAAAVAEFGMILRRSPHGGSGSLRDVIAWANAAASPQDDPRGYRRDFVALARKAQPLFR